LGLVSLELGSGDHESPRKEKRALAPAVKPGKKKKLQALLTEAHVSRHGVAGIAEASSAGSSSTEP
jgi:hypothetical protein